MKGLKKRRVGQLLEGVEEHVLQREESKRGI